MQSTINDSKKCLSCRHSDQISFQEPQTNSTSENSSDLNMIYIKCSECQIIQCKPCFKQHLADNHHLREHETSNNQVENQTVFEIICQECEQNDSRKFCENCQQHLCDKCSFRIHNKGKRAKHNVLSNEVLIKIQKLFFLNKQQTQQEFKSSNEFDSSNCLVVYSPERPDFIQQFESLEVEDMNRLSIEQIESCLNRYPLISLFSVHENDRQLAGLLTHLVVDSDNQEDEQKQAYIFLGGFKIVLHIRRAFNKMKLTKSIKQNAILTKYGQKDRILLDHQLTNEHNDSLTTVMKAPNNEDSPQFKKFIKKQQIDFSCGSKEEHQPIIEMNKMFKKSLKMSNRSLIIEIPETKQYKQSPIKSDREQGFIERNLKLLQNANNNKTEKSQQNKTITLHLDENYNDFSGSTLNYYELSEIKSNNDASILLMGSAMNDNESHNDSSFRLMTNNQTIVSQNSTSFLQNNMDEVQNNIDESQNNMAGSLSLLHVGNISLSTENSIRKRSRKAPIPYFQPLKSKTVDNLNNSYGYMHGQRLKNRLEKKFRQLAQSGVLMVSRKQLQEFGLGYDDKIIRKMKKTVCEEQIEYYSLNLQLISIQSLYWIMQSIKADMMTPSEKLILSRLKQSYNLKPAQKLWTYIIKYLESQDYLNDKMAYDKVKQLPQIIVGREGDEVLLQYEERWVYEDQQGPQVENEEWEMFRVFLNEYFKMNKQITGGRYGCVQYVKLNGPAKLRKCSLGRLSYFVQQAINKGLIRYHKTLLIQNYQSFQQSLSGISKKQQANLNLNPQLPKGSQQQSSIQMMFQAQKQIKILKIQLTLIEIFLQAGQECEISLAQIPLTFKKMILFDVNLLQLGYPKLKNMLQTLTDKLVLSSSKSHIKYKEVKSQNRIEQLKGKYQQKSEQFVSQLVGLVEMSLGRQCMMTVNELCAIVNERLGFVLDWRVCEVQDFCQFLMYYCQGVCELQFINGNFFVCVKGTLSHHYQGSYGHNLNPYHHCGHPNQCHYPTQQYYCHINHCYTQIGGNLNGGFDHQQCANYYLMNQNFNEQALNHTLKQKGPVGYNHYYHHNEVYHTQGHYNKQYQLPMHNHQQGYVNNCHQRHYNNTNQSDSGHYYHNNDAYSHNHFGQIHLNSCNYYNQQQVQHLTYQHQHLNSYKPSLHPRHKQQPLNPPPQTEISTPKFNQSLQYINKKQFNNQNIKSSIQNFKWQSYLDDISNLQQNEDKNNNFETESFTDYQSIYNILDDDQHSESKSKLSLPKTFIEKEGSSCNHNQGELHISKITPIDERSDRDEDCDGSLGLFDESPEKDIKLNIVEQGLKSARKAQHTRVYSTTQARTKHQRMYSTTTAKN